MNLNIKEALQDTRLIFTITTGRSGTNYLSIVLDYLPNVSCFHEPEPKFSSVLNQIQGNPEAGLNFWKNEKLPHIFKKKLKIYIETSHLFSKGFVEPLLELDVIPDIIILERNPRDVAKSFYQINSIPSRTESSSGYMINPDWEVNLKISDWKNLNDYQLCYWYCLETKFLMNMYEEIFKKEGANVVYIRFEEIFTIWGYIKLVQKLKLGLDIYSILRFIRHKNTKINAKTQSKKRILPKNLEDLEKEVINLIKKENSFWEHIPYT